MKTGVVIGWAAPTKIDLKNGGQNPLYKYLNILQIDEERKIIEGG